MPVSDIDPSKRAGPDAGEPADADSTEPGSTAAAPTQDAPTDAASNAARSGPAPDGAPSLGPDDLASAIDALGVQARIVRPGAPTPTVASAADALGVTEDRIIKSLVFVVEPDRDAEPNAEPTSLPSSADPRELVLVIAAGTGRIDTDRLADAIGTDPRRLRLARPAEVAAWTGYGVGAMPPFGHLRPLRTLIDVASVPGDGVVYGGGGSRRTMLEIGVDALEAATRARRADLTSSS